MQHWKKGIITSSQNFLRLNANEITQKAKF